MNNILLKMISADFVKAVDQFWLDFAKYFNTIKNSLDKSLDIIKIFTPEIIQQRVDFQLTYGEINRKEVDFDIIELYISPCLSYDNIEYAKYLQKKNIIKDLSVVLYRAHHKLDETIQSVDYTDFSVNINDISVIAQCGRRNNLIIYNLIIKVKQEIANKILKKVKVVFENSSRYVYQQIHNKNAIDIFLINLLSEEKLLNYVGYIEYLEENSITTDDEFKPLKSLIPIIDMAEKQNKIKCCSLCDRSELCINIYKFSDDKHYCVTCKK